MKTYEQLAELDRGFKLPALSECVHVGACVDRWLEATERHCIGDARPDHHHAVVRQFQIVVD